MLSSEVWCSRVSCASPSGSPDSMAARVLLGNPDGVAPDSNARSVSSGRGVPTPCTCRRSPLRSIAQSTRGRIPCADISYPEFRALTFYIRISHSRMGEEDVSTSPIRLIRDPLIALTRRVFLLVYSAAVFSWSFLIFPTDILGYFALNIFCLNPKVSL